MGRGWSYLSPDSVADYGEEVLDATFLPKPLGG